jgi:glycosyltransferase involved in cell wall biosynthesis
MTASTPLGVNLVGPVTYLNGLGVSSRGYMRALAAAGIKLNVVPWRWGFEDLKEMRLEMPSVPLQQTSIVHLNMDLLVRGSPTTDPLKEILAKERRTIGIFYWELAAIPPEWFPVIQAFDEIWCASSFMHNSISAVSAKPVRLLRPALTASERANPVLRRDLGLPQGRFSFFYTADFSAVVDRKNPKALLDAYLSEFSETEGACCIIKVNYSQSRDPTARKILDAAKARPDVVFVDTMLDEAEMAGLYGAIDCYVSPHRSEGLGLTVIEAMMLGKPVIATPYGGVSDFVSPASAYPLEYSLVEVPPDCWPYPPGYIWADPSIASLRTAMRRVFERRDEARERGRSGRALVEKLFSSEETSRKVSAALRGAT